MIRFKIAQDLYLLFCSIMDRNVFLIITEIRRNIVCNVHDNDFDRNEP